MERLDGTAAIPAALRGGIIALGNFDGFHAGHQAVVGRAIERAQAEGRPAIVATFDPHPVRFFKPDSPFFRLTSLDQRDLARTGIEGSPHDHVLRLADLAHDAGLDGIVCSGQEVGAVHKQWKDGFFVVPGLRPAGAAAGDQKRTVTPRSARDDGASVLVIGRPISRAEDPLAAARAIEATL